MYISTTERSLGALIAQEKGGIERPIYYLSRLVRGAECNYSPIEKQCLALVYVAQRLRNYMLAHKIHLVSRSNPFRYMMRNPIPSSRLTRWLLVLSEFDIQVIPPTGKKSQALAELLAAFPTMGNDMIDPEIPGVPHEIATIDGEQEWQLMFDGSATTGKGGIGIVLISPESKTHTKACKLMYGCSNNEAEYEALIAGLEFAASKGAKSLIVKGDSRLVIQQLKGEFAVKELALTKYRTEVQQLLQKFQSFSFEHVPRSQNRYADALATLASRIDDQEIGKSVITVEAKQPMASTVKEAIFLIEVDDWRKCYLDFLVKGIVPETKTEELRLKKHIVKYMVKEGHLYRKAYNGHILKCISGQEAEEILQEVHEGDCGEHQGGRRLYEEALRLGYFWPTMERDAMDYARRCKSCQFFGNKIHAPAVTLHPINAPWPFHTWALDLIGPISPPSKGRVWILTATENFTK
ncbi:hypothetical protein UlMin_002773 [Ulmus minor]